MAIDELLAALAQNFWTAPVIGAGFGAVQWTSALLPSQETITDEVLFLKGKIQDRRVKDLHRVMNAITPSVDALAPMADQTNVYEEYVAQHQECDEDVGKLACVGDRLLAAKGASQWLTVPQVVVFTLGLLVHIPWFRAILLLAAVLLFGYQLWVCRRGCRLRGDLRAMQFRPHLLKKSQ